jgi:tubby-related protein 1
VSVFENGIYGQSGPHQNGDDGERDTIPSYQPLSARSAKSLAESPLLASSLGSNSSRPVSRLGVQRGATGAPPASSKFVVPPLNLKALNTENDMSPTASSGHSAIYLRNQGLPLPIPKEARPAEILSAAGKAPQHEQQASSGIPKQPVRSTKFTLPLRPIHRSSSNEEGQDPPSQQNSGGGGGSGSSLPLMAERSSAASTRPISRLGRPLTSMAQNDPASGLHMAASSSTSASPSAKPSISTRRSGLPNFTGAYRTSDHNELLLKASGWVERPQTSSGTETGSNGVLPPKERPSVEATAVWVAASKSFVRSNSLRASFASNSSRPSSAAVAAKAASAIIPRLSNYAAARRFLLAPGPVNEPLRCRVERRKSGLLGTSMHYVMVLEEGKCMMLTAKRHRRANGAASFDIYVAPPAGAPEDASICVAKLQASFLGTEYVLIGAGMEEGGSSVGPESSAVTYGFSDTADGKKRSSQAARLGAGKGGEMGAIVYNPNIMGTKGPRKATVVLPKLVPSGESAWELQPGLVNGALVSKQRQGDTSECIVLRNRPPRWNAALGAYCLHFGGRVTHASVKNIQLIADDDAERILLQFGRVGDDSFTLDYQFPVTPLQAFAVALASLDPKLGCE